MGSGRHGLPGHNVPLPAGVAISADRDHVIIHCTEGRHARAIPCRGRSATLGHVKVGEVAHRRGNKHNIIEKCKYSGYYSFGVTKISTHLLIMCHVKCDV